MPHIVRDIGWGTIDIVVHEHRIFFQQRWLYDWNVAPGQPAWTTPQRRAFHAQVDRLVWRSWSNRVRMRASGRHAIASGGTWPMNLDVRWVLRDPQWTVTVTKVAPGTDGVGEVFWTSRRITLNTGDLVPYRACTAQPAATRVCRDNFDAVPHEFGHAIGNTAVLARGDEYQTTSPHLADTTSIMNIGREMRARHFRTIIEQMDLMVPGVTWSVSSIRT
jgi:hypothetical protein